MLTFVLPNTRVGVASSARVVQTNADGRFTLLGVAGGPQPINALGLRFLGRYVVNVWRVNEAYAQLYAMLQQDSRDLNEPFTNISGGLGVFTAFSADTTSIVVVR